MVVPFLLVHILYQSENFVDLIAFNIRILLF